MTTWDSVSRHLYTLLTASQLFFKLVLQVCSTERPLRKFRFVEFCLTSLSHCFDNFKKVTPLDHALRTAMNRDLITPTKTGIC